MRNYCLDVNVQVWEDENGDFWYLVQTTDESGEQDEILAYGQADSKLGALITVRDEFLETLNE